MSNEKAAQAPVSVNKPTVPATPRSGRVVMTLVLVGMGTFAVGAGYWLKRIYEPGQVDVAEALVSSDRSITGLGGEVRSLHEKLMTMERAQQTQTDTVARVTDEVTRIRADLATQAAPAMHLRLARIEHLVKSADLSLRLAHDVRAADAALAAAQAELNVGNPREAAFKERLAADRAALAAVTAPDIGVLSARWADIALAIDHWPWPAAATRPATSADAGSAEATGNWRMIAAKIWEDLRQLVEIRSVDEPDRALDPAHETLVKAGLKTEISTLRAALAARDEQAVRASVAVLAHTLASIFGRSDSAIAAVQAALDELATLSLTPALPTLDDSLRGLADLHMNELPVPPPSAGEPPGDSPRDLM